MKEFGDIESFVCHLAVLAVEETLAARHALSKVGKLVEKSAKGKIGEYQQQTGPFAAWAELAESTKRDRESKGYPEDEPLLRTGDLRDSIGHTISTTSLEVQIGSNSDIAVFQELGTSRMPPRSFLGGAMADKLPEIRKIIEETTLSVLMGRGIEAKLLGEEVVEGGIAIGK